MYSYKLTIDDKILPINTVKKYKFNALDDIRNRLSNCKNKLDYEFKNRNFNKYWLECDPFKHEKYLIAKMGNTFNVSNAWLKCYEIIDYFKLLPEEQSENYIHFDNAAFPGSFIVAAHHYVNTRRSWGEKYQWYGSSLLDKNQLDSEPFEDRYKLYKNYPKQWLMDKNNNGDVLNEKNLFDFKNKLSAGVDLYTSDIGFDVSADYNNQESMQAPVNLGQILAGLITLKKGGHLITKQYTIFEPTTISYMYMTGSLFEEFYLIKPFTSREANSETYLLGKGFKGFSEYKDDPKQHPYIAAMLSVGYRIEQSMPLIAQENYPLAYIDDIKTISERLFDRQIQKINKDIEVIHQAYQSGWNGPPSKNPAIGKYYNDNIHRIIDWHKTHLILPIDPKKILTMDDLYKQYDLN